MVAVIADAPPLYGTWTVSLWIPANATNMATAKWLVEAGPPEAELSLLGCALASGMRSKTFANGSEGLSHSTVVTHPNRETRHKTLDRHYARVWGAQR